MVIMGNWLGCIVTARLGCTGLPHQGTLPPVEIAIRVGQTVAGQRA
jgi:hypothetical protein